MERNVIERLEIKCVNCSEVGHRARDCTQARRRDNVQPKDKMDILSPPRNYRARQVDLLLKQFQNRVVTVPRNSISTPAGTKNSARKLQVLDRVDIPCLTPPDTKKQRSERVASPATSSPRIDEFPKRVSSCKKTESSPAVVADTNAPEADESPDRSGENRVAIFRGPRQRNSFRVEDSDEDDTDDESAGHESERIPADRPRRAAAIKARQSIYRNRHSEAGRHFRITLPSDMYEDGPSMNQVQHQAAPPPAPVSQPRITLRPRAPLAARRRQPGPAPATRGRKRRRESSSESENESPAPKREPAPPANDVLPSVEFDVETFLGQAPRIQTGGAVIQEEQTPQAARTERAVAAQRQVATREPATPPNSHEHQRQHEQSPRHAQENVVERGTEVARRTRQSEYESEDESTPEDDRAVRNALGTNMHVIENLERRLTQARRDARDLYMREVHAIREELVYNYRLYLDQL